MSNFSNGLRSGLAAAALVSAWPAGAGIFTEQVQPDIPNLYNSRAAWRDADRDNYQDFAIQGRVTKGTTGLTAIYRWNSTTKKFELHRKLADHSEGNVVWGDFNNDELHDLVVTGAIGTATPTTVVYENLGSASGWIFNPIAAASTGLPGTLGGAYVSDFNRDGRDDILIIGGAAGQFAASIHLATADFKFSKVASSGLTAIGEDPSAAIADFNRDGIPDIALSGKDTPTSCVVRVFQGNGNGTFTAKRTMATGLWDGALAAGDYDGNGKPDLAAIGKTIAGQGQAFLYRNDDAGGNFAFTQLSQAASGLDNVYCTALQFADFSNDGKPDLVLAGFSTSSSARVARIYTNMGAAAVPVFKEAAADAGSMLKADRGFAILADLDFDRKLDLLVGGKTVNSNPAEGKTVFYKNTGAANKGAPSMPTNFKVLASYDGVRNNLKVTWDGSTAAPTPAAALTYHTEIEDISGPGAGKQLVTGLILNSAHGNAGTVKFLNLVGMQPNRTIALGGWAVDANYGFSPYGTGGIWHVGGNASFNWDVTNGNIDLSAGATDWVHWGRSGNMADTDRKYLTSTHVLQAVGLSNFDVSATSNMQTSFNWSGAATAPATASWDWTGVRTSYGYQIRLRADAVPRTYRIYVGAINTPARFSVIQSDGSNTLNRDFAKTTKEFVFNLTVARQPGSSDPYVHVNWMCPNPDGTTGSVTLMAVAAM